MTKITISLPTDLALWISGYAACRKLSCSRALSDILIEKRASISREAEELSIAQEAFERVTQTKTFLEFSKEIADYLKAATGGAA